MNMVNKCVAPGCKTGYSGKKENNETKISKFKFAMDEEKRKQCVSRIPRKDWLPSKNSVLYEKHFLLRDFQENREDNTPGRKDKKRGS